MKSIIDGMLFKHCVVLEDYVIILGLWCVPVIILIAAYNA